MGSWPVLRRPVTPPSAAVPAQVTAAHARYLLASVDSLYARDQAVGGAGPLLRQGLMHWQYARRMLGESSYTEPMERQLLAINSELAICTGWLAFDGGNVPLARYLYAEAHLTAGHAAIRSSPRTRSKSGRCSAVTSHDSGAANERRSLAREGLRLALQAADQARHEPVPRLHALIAMRHANATSLLGDEAAFRSAITRARRELDRGTRADDPEWIQFVDETEITGHEAMGVRTSESQAAANALSHRSRQ